MSVVASDTKVDAFHRFMELPVELRLKVYEHLVVISDPWACGRPLPAIFLANKKIFAEAMDVFLHNNSFHMYTETAGMEWVQFLLDTCKTGVVGNLTVFMDRVSPCWFAHMRPLLTGRPFGVKVLSLRSSAVGVGRKELEYVMEELLCYLERQSDRVEYNSTSRSVILKLEKV
ncbi:hypothetical protein SCUP234_06811 [Seiridium cupressi]